MASAAVEYQLIHDIEQLNQIVRLELDVWGLDPIDAVPANIMHAIAMYGGVVIGASVHGRLVGMSLALPLYCVTEWVLWSHMVGVHPNFRGQKIGFHLKQAQRSWALGNGFQSMRWTFDPLQKGNASFNLKYLGAQTNKYHINLYGEMTDNINAGLPSDRLEVFWKLGSEEVERLAGAKKAPASASHVKDGIPLFILEQDDLLNPRYHPLETSETKCAIEIPYDLGALKILRPKMAHTWRIAVREAFSVAIADGFVAIDFVDIGNRCWYILERM